MSAAGRRTERRVEARIMELYGLTHDALLKRCRRSTLPARALVLEQGLATLRAAVTPDAANDTVWTAVDVWAATIRDVCGAVARDEVRREDAVDDERGAS